MEAINLPHECVWLRTEEQIYFFFPQVVERISEHLIEPNAEVAVSQASEILVEVGNVDPHLAVEEVECIGYWRHLTLR